MKTKIYGPRIFELTLKGMSDRTIAAEIGISRQTVSNYRKDPEFKEKIRAAQDEMMQAATRRMQSALSDVAGVAIEIAQDAKNAPQVRLNAVQILLTQCRAWTETSDVLNRLSALEESVNENNQNIRNTS
ncbi:MAG: helix-turn-helix domain-containing protein [Clostridiales bacterium]|nr:helix-turn-helix domain-containing protein [Clostridiales bacterium]